MSYQAIYAYPWDLADAGVAGVLDEVAALGIDNYGHLRRTNVAWIADALAAFGHRL